MSDTPLNKDRIDVFVDEISSGATELVQAASKQINEISIVRAMQVGYMLACKDHGIEQPHFEDPAVTLFKEALNNG